MTPFRLLVIIAAGTVVIYFGSLAISTLNSDGSNELGGEFKNQPFVTLTEVTPQRIRDLTQIAIALEKYKQENHRYPTSKSDDRDWSMRITISGKPSPDWINGLVPDYLAELPRDPRLNDIYTNQYAYKSDGVHYKLLALYPEDCEVIKAALPNMVAYECAAYGYWSEKAISW